MMISRRGTALALVASWLVQAWADSMPGIGGIAATDAILSRHPDVVVVLISVDDPTVHPAVRALGGAVPCARKQDLRPSEVRRLWEMRGS